MQNQTTMKNSIVKLAFISTFLLIINSSFSRAQGNAHNNDNGKGHHSHGNGNGNGHDKHQSVPIDGGVSILIAAGAILGLKKLKDYHRIDSN